MRTELRKFKEQSVCEVLHHFHYILAKTAEQQQFWQVDLNLKL
jgi:hypothetical protein